LKVRIKNTPREREIDGVKLDSLVAGTVYEASASVGSWLVAEGYAWLEMRQDQKTGAGLKTSGEPDRRVKHLQRASMQVQRNPFIKRA
jgi:hypothetical protein